MGANRCTYNVPIKNTSTLRTLSRRTRTLSDARGRHDAELRALLATLALPVEPATRAAKVETVDASTQTGLEANTQEFWAQLASFEAFLRYAAGRDVVSAFGAQPAPRPHGYRYDYDLYGYTYGCS